MSQTNQLIINIDQELKKQAKAMAENLGISLSSLIEDLLTKKIKKTTLSKIKLKKINHKGITFTGPINYNKNSDLPLNNKEISDLTSKIKKAHKTFIKNRGKAQSLKEQLNDLL